MTKFSQAPGYMLDKKAAHCYMGLGGCYCDLCNLSKFQCIDRFNIENGFQITRDIDELHNIFSDLVQDDEQSRRHATIMTLGQELQQDQ